MSREYSNGDPATSAKVSREAAQILPLILELIRTQTGQDFTDYKSATLVRRITQRAEATGCSSLGDYHAYLEQRPEELPVLLHHLLVRVTGFFRDPALWHHLIHEVLPPCLGQCPPSSEFRVWVAGCATGEEAYTFAIVLRQVLADNPKLPQDITLRIFATDLNADAIAVARRGRYSTSALEHLPAHLRSDYFEQLGDELQVRDAIRKSVTFALQNVVTDPPFSRLNLLSCRNVLIYMASELQQAVLHRLHRCLLAQGLLVLGSAESVGHAPEYFVPLSESLSIYQRADVASPALQAPARMEGMSTSMALVLDTRLARATLRRGVVPEVQQTLERIMLEQYAPVGIVVDSQGQILYISGRSGSYLEPAAGRAAMDLFAMAREGLRPTLTEMFHQVQRTGQSLRRGAVRIGERDHPQWADVLVRPLEAPASAQGPLLVVIGPAAEPAQISGPDSRIQELERELEHAYRELRATTENIQQWQEYLEAANEELQSSNEELQSSNEELATTTEELRSTNAQLEAARSAERAARAMYEDLFESAPVGYALIDRDGLIMQVNREARRMLAAAPYALVGTPLVLHIIEPHRLRFSEYFQQAWGNPDVRHCEVTLWADGLQPCHVQLAVQSDVGHAFARVVLDDITAHANDREQLRHALNQVRNLKRALDASMLVVTTDREGRILEPNEQVVQLSGYSREELIGQDFRLVNSGVHSKEYMRQMWQTINGGEVWRGEFCNRSRSGQLYWVDTTIVPFLDEMGQPYEYVAIRTDVTERKRLEALRLTDLVNQFAEATLESLPMQICVLDGRGVITSLNREWRRYMEQCGLDLNVVGQSASALEACHVRMRSERSEFLVRLDALLSGENSGFDMECTCHCTGAPRSFAVRVVRFRAAAEDRLVVVRIDITESRQAAEKIDAQMTELKRWYQATLGREMRLLELKREVNLLLTELGRRPKYASVEDR